MESIKKSAGQTADVITLNSDSDGPAITEEIAETSAQVLANDDTDGVTETVEVESSLLATNDHPDDEIMETMEELGSFNTMVKRLCMRELLSELRAKTEEKYISGRLHKALEKRVNKITRG